MLKTKYLIASKMLVLALLLFCFPCQSLAYNKSWDQGHDCVKPGGGDSGWGKYDYDGVFHGGYTSKECCELYCKICPVYAYTGQLQKTFVDLTVPGVGPSLAINRTYLSQDFATSLLGRGWMFNFGKRLIITRNKAGDRVVGVRQETGEKNFFKEYPDGTLELLADYGVTYQITKNPGGSYTILNADDSIHNLDSDGKITSIVDKNGNTLSFEYSEVGCLSRITNASGNYIDFQMGPNGKIASITDNFDRTVSYTYDTNGSLTASTDPMGESTLYAYDSNKRLTQITDPRENTVISVTYDTHQPARIATFTEKGETWTIAYHPEAVPAYTTKTDSSSHTWTYYANDVGIIEKVVDPSGHVKQEQHHNKVTSTSMDWEEDGEDNRTTYTYDEFGNIASKTDALNHTWTYTYVPGTYRIETETSPLDIVTKYEYDTNGNQTEVIRDYGGAMGNTTTYTYDSLGRKTSVTDPLEHETTYEYDDDGNLLTITDPLNHVITYTYDGRGNKLTETNANNHTTTYTYDLMDRLLTVTDALDHTTTYTYDENGNKVSETNANDDATTYIYDAYNRLAQVNDPLDNTTSYEYDSKDNRTSETDALSHTTTYTYNSLNQLTCVTNALSKSTNYTYDLADNVLTITDAGEKTTTFTYDAANRISSETNAANETTSYTYDAEGKRLTAALPNGNTITTTYDRLGHVSSISDTLGLIRSYTYYANGLIETESDAMGNTITYSYDEANRLIERTDATDNSMSYTYDAAGNLLSVTDREDHTTSYEYDAAERKISVTDPLEHTTEFAYDDVGNLLSITDAEENVTSYTYDAANRLTQETYEDETTRSFTYDDAGNLHTRTDQKDQVTTYSYDAVNRTTGVDYPGSNDIAFTYDDAGNLLTANNQNATISLTYDNAYRVTQSVQNNKTVGYSYDIPNRTKTITYPGSKVVKEVRLENDLLASVKNSSNQSIVEYGYDDANRLDEMSYLNGVTADFTNNANGWITDLTYNPSQMVRFQYGFDNEGNRLYEKKLHSLSSSEQYIYDAKYRLVQFKRGTLDGNGNIPSPVTQTAYTLDAVGNWASKTTDSVTENRTHNAMNELVGIDSSTLTYDDNGNLTDDGTNTYEYDYENRLTKVTRKSDSVVLGQYKYDALGRRVEKQASGTTTAYYYDGNRIIEEQVSGTTAATYVYGIGMDEVVSMERGGSTYYYLANSLGSIAALTNSSGSILEQYSYDAYGQPNIASSYGNPYMFTGRQRDSESSLQYNRNRYLSYSLGRWTTHDPIGYEGGLNVYEYVGSNPINLLDPLGLKKQCVVKSGPTYLPSGTIKATLSGGVKAASFNMSAEFENDKKCDALPECCEVRQYIMWQLDSDRPNHPGFSPASSYQKNTWYEDRDGNNKRYGHRSGPYSDPQPFDHYEDASGAQNQTSGVRYVGSDRPVDGSGAKTGAWYFKLIVIDVCNSNGVVGKTSYVTVDW